MADMSDYTINERLIANVWVNDHERGRTDCEFFRLGIGCERLPRAAVGGRQTRSFVYRVRVQYRSAAAACGC